MSATLTMWLPGFAAALVGLAAGLLAALASSQREAAGRDVQAELDDLEQRKEHLVELLRELEQQRDRMEPGDYEEQRATLEQQAASALRAHEALLADGTAAAASRRKMANGEATRSVGLLRRRPWLRAVLWAGGTAAVLAVAVAFVVQKQSTPGGDAEAAAQAVPAELVPVVKRLEADPTDVDALVDGADILLEKGRVAAAAPFVDRALQLDPERPEALVQLAWLKLVNGDAAAARGRIDAVVQRHPELASAWWVRGRIGMESGDNAMARESFEQFVALAPDGPQRRSVLKALSQDGDSGAAASLWAERCSSCHGARGKADTPMGRAMGIPDMTAADWQRRTSDERIRQVLREGIDRQQDGHTQRMPAFPELQPQQLDGLRALIRSGPGG